MTEKSTHWFVIAMEEAVAQGELTSVIYENKEVATMWRCLKCDKLTDEYPVNDVCSKCHNENEFEEISKEDLEQEALELDAFRHWLGQAPLEREIWYFTWGQGQVNEGYVQPIEGDRQQSRVEMFTRHGNKWGFQYSAADWATAKRNNTELALRYGLSDYTEKELPIILKTDYISKP